MAINLTCQAKSLCGLLLVIWAFSGRASEWPEWRGPTAQGHAQAKGLPTHWSETSNVVWKTEIPGRGWSSPVIEGNEIWLTTAVERSAKPEDAARRAKTSSNNQPLTVLGDLELRAIALDRATGRMKHNLLLLTEHEPQRVHELNSYASPSPVLEDGRLYCHFGAFGNACVDTRAARVLWTNDTLRINHENGPGSSPIVWRDLLVFHLDGSDTQSIVALNKQNGSLVWRTTRSGAMVANPQGRKSYATPLVLDVAGEPELFSAAADWLYGYNPRDGRELWKLAFGAHGYSLSARPVADGNTFFTSIGFDEPELLAIRYGAKKNPEILWRYAKGVSTMSSLLLVGNELYFVSDSGGILTCLEASTGKEHYRERLGGNHCSSPILADGRIYLASREGVTSVIKPGATFELVSQNKLSGKIMASPAAIGAALFVRTDAAMYKLEQRK
jgi:outer membrane protein assembly factor BamB